MRHAGRGQRRGQSRAGLGQRSARGAEAIGARRQLGLGRSEECDREIGRKGEGGVKSPFLQQGELCRVAADGWRGGGSRSQKEKRRRWVCNKEMACSGGGAGGGPWVAVAQGLQRGGGGAKVAAVRCRWCQS